eukprot:scaffold44_cov339-Pavlova_lutheri.AAC.27
MTRLEATKLWRRVLLLDRRRSPFRSKAEKGKTVFHAGSECAEDLFGAGDGECAAFFEVEQLHDAVIHEHGVAPGSDPESFVGEIEVHAQRFGPDGGTVCQHGHFVLHADGLSPRVHDERIVDGHAADLVHAFGGEFVGFVHESRQVLQAAGGREGARHGEQHHFLPLREIFDRNFLHVAFAVEVGQLPVRQSLSHFDRLSGRHRRPTGGPDRHGPRYGRRGAQTARRERHKCARCAPRCERHSILIRNAADGVGREHETPVTEAPLAAEDPRRSESDPRREGDEFAKPWGRRDREASRIDIDEV